MSRITKHLTDANQVSLPSYPYFLDRRGSLVYLLFTAANSLDGCGMPALPSFINYKSGRKTKTIKSPFSLLRGEPSTSTATANLPRYVPIEVIDIHDQGGRYSLDFDGGKPIDDYENPIVDQEPSHQGAATSSPQVQLDIDFSTALTDWFPADLLQSEGTNGFAEGWKPSGSGVRNGVANTSASTGGLGFPNGGKDSSTGNDDEDGGSSTLSSSEDIIANLAAMNVSFTQA